MSDFDLRHPRHIHIVGVGGSGMSAIATVLAAMGHHVSGSDAAASAALDAVTAAGVRTFVGHDGRNLDDRVEVLAISTAVGPDNSEVVAARERGIPVLRRAEMLTAIARTRRTAAVAGTHGKTTTSTLLAAVLEAGDTHPSWIIGGEILGRGNGARWDDGAWFVVEADESDGTFLELGAEAVIVTNVEPDHLEHYGGWEQLQQAFDRFVDQTPGPKVVCADDEGAAALATRTGATTYGTDDSADFRIVDVELDRFSARFVIAHGDTRTEVLLHAPGLHNVRNATAALVLGHLLGVSMEVGRQGIEAYQGVGRRFQHRGERGGVTFVDDYAHLPSEVAAAVSAARDGDWGRVIAVFQPHRYSRTEQVGQDFGGSFDGVDLLILTDVYAAGETARPGIDGRVVVRAVEAEAGHPEVLYIEDRATLAPALVDLLRDGDLCLTLGAGDITRLATEIQALS